MCTIHSTLNSGLSSIKLKVFASNVVKTILSEDVIDENKFADAFSGSIESAKSAYSCVRFLLLSAVRFGVGKDIFSIELQQLGLPREHSLALGKVLDEHSASIAEQLKGKSLTINEVIDSKCKESDGIDCVHLEIIITKFQPKGNNQHQNVVINKSDIPILIKELKFIKEQMVRLDFENQ